MPLRHYAGTIRTAPVAWKCPSCQAENTGALEGGCVQCGAGKDGKSKLVQPIEALPPALVHEPVLRDPVHQGFQQWYDTTTLPDIDAVGLIALLEQAFNGGVNWHISGGRGVPAGYTPITELVGGAAPAPAQNAEPPKEPYMIALVDPVSHEPEYVDQATQATLVAALNFYLGNQLAYGAIPGQLNAEQARALLNKLQSSEEIA